MLEKLLFVDRAEKPESRDFAKNKRKLYFTTKFDKQLAKSEYVGRNSTVVGLSLRVAFS